MGIKATELQATTAPKVTDTLLVANSAGGTSQLTLAQAAAFLGGEMVKPANPVGAALSSKAALSTQETVEKTAISGREVTVAAAELQVYINALPRLRTENLAITVTGDLTQKLVLSGFYGSGSLHFYPQNNQTVFRAGIEAANCAVDRKSVV